MTISKQEQKYQEAIRQLCIIRDEQKNDVMYFAIKDIQEYVENIKKGDK